MPKGKKLKASNQINNIKVKFRGGEIDKSEDIKPGISTKNNDTIKTNKQINDIKPQFTEKTNNKIKDKQKELIKHAEQEEVENNKSVASTRINSVSKEDNQVNNIKVKFRGGEQNDRNDSISNASTNDNSLFEDGTSFYRIKPKSKAGRRAKSVSGFNVTIHKTNNKYRYLTIQRKRNVNGNLIYCHWHLGRLDDKNEFLPSRNYIYSTHEFKRSLTFPKCVKMNVLEKLERDFIENRYFKEEEKEAKEKIKEKEYEYV